MASKYAHLKGRIPEQETPRDRAFNDKRKEWENDTLDQLTEMYNAGERLADELATSVKKVNLNLAVLEYLIRKRLDGLNADSVSQHGYTWSEKFEPYPVAEDPEEIIRYFKDNGMEDQLQLTNTELAGRLKKHVKDEAQNNELQITIEEVDDPDAPGGKRETTVVRSQVPGVKVYLKPGLSRVKSKGAKA